MNERYGSLLKAHRPSLKEGFQLVGTYLLGTRTVLILGSLPGRQPGTGVQAPKSSAEIG